MRDLLSAGAGVCIDSVVLVYVILELGCIYIYIYIYRKTEVDLIVFFSVLD